MWALGDNWGRDDAETTKYSTFFFLPRPALVFTGKPTLPCFVTKRESYYWEQEVTVRKVDGKGKWRIRGALGYLTLIPGKTMNKVPHMMWQSIPSSRVANNTALGWTLRKLKFRCKKKALKVSVGRSANLCSPGGRTPCISTVCGMTSWIALMKRTRCCSRNQASMSQEGSLIVSKAAPMLGYLWRCMASRKVLLSFLGTAEAAAMCPLLDTLVWDGCRTKRRSIRELPR